jgi:hypothetical protein
MPLEDFTKKTKEKNIYKKGLIIVCVFLIIEAAVFLPIFYKKLQYDNLNAGDIKSIEYVKYEKELFSSVIMQRRYTEDMQIISDFTRSVNNGKIKPFYKQNNVNQILIIKTSSGRTIYAYLCSDILGFDYGKINIQIDSLADLIIKIPETNLVTVQN